MSTVIFVHGFYNQLDEFITRYCIMAACSRIPHPYVKYSNFIFLDNRLWMRTCKVNFYNWSYY